MRMAARSRMPPVEGSNTTHTARAGAAMRYAMHAPPNLQCTDAEFALAGARLVPMSRFEQIM